MSKRSKLIWIFNYIFPILGYILTPSPDIRPDIFQVSFLAFNIAGKKNPVQNLNVSKLSSKHIIYIYIHKYWGSTDCSFDTISWFQKVSEPNFDNISVDSCGSNPEKASKPSMNVVPTDKINNPDSSPAPLKSGAHSVVPGASGMSY